MRRVCTAKRLLPRIIGASNLDRREGTCLDRQWIFDPETFVIL